MSGARILVVDDEPSIRRAIELVLDGHTIIAAESCEAAKRWIEGGEEFDVALIDKNLPDGSGVDLIQLVHAHRPSVPVILITGYPTLESAIDAVAKGAFDYVLKPFDTLDLRHKVQMALEKSQLQAQLRRAERLETVGRFASSIAHDLNNLLTVFATSSGFLAEFLAQHEDTLNVSEPLEDVAAISHACDSAVALTRQLLTFSSHEAVTPQDIDVNDVVQRLQKTMLRTIGSAVQVKLDLGSGIPPVRMDRGQCEQVVLNLVLNARDAMPKGGTICVSTSAEGSLVRVKVQDDGAGMDEVTLTRIFEPFFTTKGNGRGTGLGLASVQRIVASLGGTVSVDSAVDRGTTITLDLPAVTEARPKVSSRPSPAIERRGRVLLIEEDVAVRASLTRLLRDAGYEVLSGGDGGALVQGSLPDLVVLDVAADPAVGEFVADLERTAPNTRLVLISSHALGGSEQELIVGGRPVECVAKPFRRAALLAAIERALY